MNNLRYKGILYFISGVILATLCIQIYWNYKNYNIARQQLMNDVQTSLDNAVDTYYTNLAQNKTIMLLGDSIEFSAKNIHFQTGTLKKNPEFPNGKIKMEINSLPNGTGEWRSSLSDSTQIQLSMIDSFRHSLQSITALNLIDSIPNPIETLSSKIYVSFTEDSLSIGRIDSLFTSELNRKSIDIDYGLIHTSFLQQKDTLRPEMIRTNVLSTKTSSPYFVANSSLEVFYGNITTTILKRNLLGILLSSLLILGVVLCLLYLLRIINHQKQLAEVKNDLISNITHEFKTPIATIGVAMEGIESFNDASDPEKHLRYARISREQVDKLNAMVEKLLETATLDSEELALNLETCDLKVLLHKLIHSETMIQSGKEISFSCNTDKVSAEADSFHMENALNNILDNAVKYGGEKIEVKLDGNSEELLISIFDNGETLTPQQGKQIFEKFYRVPKGNTHDVKGFGIGLYYTKKIIERHGGTIGLNLKNGTTFEIRLPHER